ncbi:hypothetical protein EHQ46_15860 [Leptospira yanagawae]|uniref:Tetratricopeptide repeat protein n=1 Tax=Leptospira yanagawae TaxID=293069 RepID=A0ABY2LXY0_9LEPT|nr:tetratricopeptide repeat protein [Leptospira yanagawae]TGL17930.1 hypothetical protein EHQ46_15860 [Leptospira yanagawae]
MKNKKRTNSIMLFLVLFFVSLIQFSNCNSAESANDHFQNGKREFLEKNLEKAKLEFQIAVDENPKSISSYIMLGKTLYYLGDFQGSLDILRKAKSKFPENPTIDFWISKNYLVVETDLSKAKEHLLNILELDDLHFEAYYYLAKINEKEGNIKEALLYYNKAKMIKKSFEKVHKDLGNLYLKAGMIERANEELAKVEKLENKKVKK